MIRSNAHHSPLKPGPRGYVVAASVISAVIVLSGCSGGTVSTPSGTPLSSNASSSASATSATTSAAPSAASPAQATAETAVKELVAGFPATLIPLMPGAQVQGSTLQRSTPLSAASLTATITATPAAVLAYYSQVFQGQGFTAQPGDTVDGVPLKTFVRAAGQEIVIVSVVQTGDSATVTVGATVLPGSLK